MKKITFAVPCYNSAEYMRKCIDSLLLAGEDCEIIIVDDGSSKDNTAEIADEYAQKFPNIIRAIHQENGGHGEAVNSGLKNARGEYFKVVDSDDWVDKNALEKVMTTIKAFTDDAPDAIIVNYVYEHVYDNTQKVVKYDREFPIERNFGFEETKKMPLGKFLAMHSLIYKTSVLKNCGLELPKHTFYVDNIVVYKPLPSVKTFYYLNVDFYRYYIGRNDQSVNEKVIMNRIDQHIRVTDILIDCNDLNAVKEKNIKLYRYMVSFLSIMMTINSIYLIKINTKESYDKKKQLWQHLKEKDIATYKKCRRSITGMTASNSKFVGAICKVIYNIARKIFKFN